MNPNSTTTTAPLSHPWLTGVVDDKPMLMIVGSYRCGTTSLFNYLAKHPQICPSLIKEPGFFFSQRWAAQPSFYPPGGEAEAYLSLFRGYAEGATRMEATSNYLHDPGCAERILAAFPGTRVVITLRDPIKRLLSWFRFLQMQGWVGPQRSLEDWLQAQFEDPRPLEQRPYGLRAVQHGCYAEAVEPFIKVFGRDRVHVVWHHQLSSNPRQVMQSLCRFAKLQAEYFDDFNFSVNNAAQHLQRRRLFMWYRKMHALAFWFLKPWPRLLFQARAEFFGRIEPRLLPLFMAPAEPLQLPEHWRQQLQSYYAADREALGALVGEMPPW